MMKYYSTLNQDHNIFHGSHRWNGVASMERLER